ncbi:hypothetical protein BJX63DRAFT_11769 [Aspergillus granulosus]|uniref:Uncharacterized protein n=1 Tax=Aspergillus granulosus TaxID=176169 RepID=A0ABR4HVH9_9EURO
MTPTGPQPEMGNTDVSPSVRPAVLESVRWGDCDPKLTERRCWEATSVETGTEGRGRDAAANRNIPSLTSRGQADWTAVPPRGQLLLMVYCLLPWRIENHAHPNAYALPDRAKAVGLWPPHGSSPATMEQPLHQVLGRRSCDPSVRGLQSRLVRADLLSELEDRGLLHRRLVIGDV